METVLHCRDHLLPIGKKTYVMGIINVTPDSFSDGGQFVDTNRAVDQLIRLKEDGADFIDIGGESTRPGHSTISDSEELMRILPVIENIPQSVTIPISVDTTKPKVAKKAMEAGIAIINSVADVGESAELMMIAADYRAGYVLMHQEQGFKTETNTMYRLLKYFEYGIHCALHSGINLNQMIIDPGIGFEKTYEQNIEIVSGLQELRRFGIPILIGLSRKSFLGSITGLPPEARDLPTVAANVLSIASGADIIRVHNVAIHIPAILVCDAIIRG